MKTILALAALLAVLPVASGAVTCRDPDRMFNGRWITLQPLFVWWSNAPAERAYARLTRAEQAALPERPMPAWMHVSGKVLEATLGGWIVEATITVSPRSNFTQKIYLLHPPEFARRDYADALSKARQADAGNKAATANAAIAGRRADNAEWNRKMAAIEWQYASSSYPDASIRANRLARERNYQNGVQQRSARAAQNYAATRAAETARAWRFGDLEGHYELDIFALRTGAVQRGLPVFDVGVRKRMGR
ncbi:MAG: hypothetical protein IPK82_23490 [Polyangiaceae bacterium]|nr:hypothetical protein [Polyangiaceae bacterium]